MIVNVSDGENMSRSNFYALHEWVRVGFCATHVKSTFTITEEVVKFVKNYI